MGKTLVFFHLALITCTAFILVSCMAPKTGSIYHVASNTSSSVVSNLPPPVNISAAYAYRDVSSSSLARTVIFQGVVVSGTPDLSAQCLSTGANCNCAFYMNTSDTNPVINTSVTFNALNNTIRCDIPGAYSAGNYSYMKLITKDNTSSSDFTTISTSLSLQNILSGMGQSLSAGNVNGIYQYACRRVFVEGDGVSGNSVSCVGNQRLGIINAEYNYYLYKNPSQNNLSAQPTIVNFASKICNYPDQTKYTCNYNSPTLKFGLYSTAAGPFSIPISFPATPDTASAQYGYAAPMDSSGNCPAGLVKARVYTAQPASINANTISDNNCNAGTINNPPSNFVNNSGSLNNTVIDVTQPGNFTVYRQPNTNCSEPTGVCSNVATNWTDSSGQNAYMIGNCQNAKLQGASTQQSVSYSTTSNDVCVLPSAILPQ